MNIDDARKELLQIIIERSFKYNEKPVFKLTSGKTSNYYINCKATTLNPASMLLIGHLIYEKIRQLDVNAIGGLTHGADPIAFSTAMVSAMKGRNIQAFVIRKEAKSHGLMKLIEGNVSEGDKVVIVDDVVTTGGSTIQAIDRAREHKLEIVKAIALVDRQEGGRENIEKKDVVFESLYTRDELIEAYKNKIKQVIH
ncbi:MAG: orotate phosphoribosyltransferase [Candidatus Kuenenia sp.]|nr:orotate phosphoribosyltransferase [Candidatus Kuenenia hertensis]